MLLVDLGGAAYIKRGVPAGRIGSLTFSASIFDSFSRFQNMNTKQRKEACKDLKLPFADRDDVELLQRLQRTTLWQIMPLHGLRAECRDRGIKDVEAINNTSTGEDQQSEKKRLRDLLLFSLLSDDFEFRGIAVDRLQSTQAAWDLAWRFDELDHMDLKQLRHECRALGVPNTHDMWTDELIEVLREVSLYKSFTLAELHKVCRQRDINLHPSDAQGSDNQHRAFLLDMLLLRRCARTFEQIGIPALRLSSMYAANAILSRYDQLKDMSMQQLIDEYEMMSLPHRPRLPKHELLRDLKLWTFWKHLCLEELMLECESRVVTLGHINNLNHSEAKALLLDKLRLDLFKPYFQELRIPYEKFSFSFWTCCAIVKQWDEIREKDEASLLKLYKAKVLITSGTKLNRSDLVERLNTHVVWSHCTLKDVQKLCRENLINSIARQDQKAELVSRLANHLWAPPSSQKVNSQSPPPKETPQERTRKTPLPDRRPQSRARSSTYSHSNKYDFQMQAAEQVKAHFRTLGLASDAGVDDIKRAYRKLALKYHPDKNPLMQEHAADKFRLATEAYKFLSEVFAD